MTKSLDKLRHFLDTAKSGETITISPDEGKMTSIRTVLSEWKRHNQGSDKVFFTRTVRPTPRTKNAALSTKVYCE